MEKRDNRLVLIKKSRFQNQLFFLFFFVFIFLSLQTFSAASQTTFVRADFAVSSEFCQNIHQIIESGQKKFKSVRGKLDLVSEEYFGTIIPPDLKICFGWLNGKAYHCSSPAGMTEAEVGVAYEQYNAALKSCLSAGWQTTEVNINRTSGRRFTTYTSASNPIKIKVGERNKHLGWYVDFYFRR